MCSRETRTCELEEAGELALLLGLVLIPIIVAAGFILATWKSGDRLETIEAAIVNNDDGAKVDGKTVPIGRQLTSGLVGEDENNIHWVITDEEDAKNGLSDGTYAAKLTIPEGFSRAVTSVDDAKSATQTQLDVDVSGTAPRSIRRSPDPSPGWRGRRSTRR